MSTSDIGNNVIFKKQLGLNYEIDQKYVGLKMKENNILSFNFRIPGELKDEVEDYFKRFKMGEPILVDIGGTGDIKCDFKGICRPYSVSGCGRSDAWNRKCRVCILCDSYLVDA